MDRYTELQAMIDNAKCGYDTYEPAFIELARNYMCKYDDEAYRYFNSHNKSHLFIPTITSISLKIYTSIITTYFTNPDLASVSADDQTDELASEAAQAIQDALKYYERHKLFNPFLTLSKEILNATVYPLVVIKAIWANNAPKLIPIKLRDIWFDPTATNVDDCRYIVHRIYLTKTEIERLGKFNSFSMSDVDASVADTVSDYNYQQPQKYQLHELFDVYERGDNGEWVLSTLINREIVRDEYKLKDGLPLFFGSLLPQFIMPDEEDAVEIYGASPIEAILPLQAEMNQMRNQQLDAIRDQLNRRFLTETGVGLNPMAFARGDRLLSVNTLNAIREIEPANVSQAVGSINQLQLEIQDVSSITPYNTGTGGSRGNDTATGTAILTQEANQRLNVYMQSLNESLIEPLMNHIIKLIWRYADTKMFNSVRLPRDRDPELFVHINTGLGATNPQIQQQNTDMAIQMLMQVGAQKGVMMLVKKRLEQLGITNAEEYINEQGTEQANVAAAQTAGGGEIPAGAGGNPIA